MTQHSLAIVGMGPRGHFALESFIAAMAQGPVVEGLSIALFEGSQHVGNGPVWRVDQTVSNWANVNERILTLPARPLIDWGPVRITPFPSYHTWARLDAPSRDPSDPDHYPPRRTLGAYLSERFDTLLEPLVEAGIATLIVDYVDGLHVGASGVRITTRAGDEHFADQALLCVGHQPTQLDAQMHGWAQDAGRSHDFHLFTDPYPVDRITNALDTHTVSGIAIRGYGLATIDVVRAVATRFGRFTPAHPDTGALRYEPENGFAAQMIPFSLDGLPLGAKPLNKRMDLQFKPSDTALDDLERLISQPNAQSRATDAAFLTDVMAPVIAQVFQNLPHKTQAAPADRCSLEQIIKAWISDQTYAHDAILDVRMPPSELLKRLVRLARGRDPVTVDYCIGQVWRHCHGIIYGALSHSALSHAALAKIIFLDESLKRYSFGPPVESLQQLIALNDAGVLNLEHLDDPEISVTDGGWMLSNGQTSSRANVMVNAVLEPPKIKEVTSPLIAGLLKDDVVAAAHDDLGVMTSEDAFVSSQTERPIPLAVLGRLAKGSVIGVDAILECFGTRPKRWAEAAAARTRPHAE